MVGEDADGVQSLWRTVWRFFQKTKPGTTVPSRCWGCMQRKTSSDRDPGAHCGRVYDRQDVETA